MKSPKNELYKDWFQRLSRGELQAGNYQPLCLWLIPIHFCSREQYYDDAVAATRKLIEWYWQTSRSIYPSLFEFESSDFVQRSRRVLKSTFSCGQSAIVR